MISAQRTLSGLIMVGLLNVSVPLGLAANAALPSTPEASPVTGTLLTRVSEDADWSTTKVGDNVKSHWFKTPDGSEAVISFAGDVHMRMSPGTLVHVESSSEAGLRVEVPQGDVLMTVPESGKTSVNLTTPNGTVGSSSGSFIVKVDEKRVALEVLEGSAKLSGEHVTSEQLPGVELAALDAVPGLLAEADQPPPEGNPDDPDPTNDGGSDDDLTGPIVGGAAGLALLFGLLGGGDSNNAAGGSGTPASP